MRSKARGRNPVPISIGIVLNLLWLPIDLVRWFFTGVSGGFLLEFTLWKSFRNRKTAQTKGGTRILPFREWPEGTQASLVTYTDDASPEDRARRQGLRDESGLDLRPKPPPYIRLARRLRRFLFAPSKLT